MACEAHVPLSGLIHTTSPYLMGDEESGVLSVLFDVTYDYVLPLTLLW